MDQMLKARNLSSAVERKKRIQQRLEQRSAERKRAEEEKRKQLLETQLRQDEEDDSSQSDDGLEADTGRFERESSVETPSEFSVATPEEPSPQSMIDDALATDAGLTTATYFTRDTIRNALQPKLQPSLTTFSDWSHQRFSVMPEPAGIESYLEYDSDASPIEIAQPISFQLPKMRPSVISITNGSQRRKQRTEFVQSKGSEPEAVSRSPPRAVRRLSGSSTHSGFLACEAKPFEVPDLPENATSLIAEASRDPPPAFGPRSSSRLVKKNGRSLLSENTNPKHSRMSSIKSFMWTPSQSQAPSRPISRASNQARASIGSAFESEIDAMEFETVPASLYDRPRTTQRPQTANPASSRKSMQTAWSNTSFTALPPIVSPENEKIDLMQGVHYPKRKHSLNMLSQHRPSTSQAGVTITTTLTRIPRHIPSPSMMSIQPAKPSVDLGRFPTPPLSASNSRNGQRSYSPFPQTHRLGEPIGLGVRV